MKESYGGMFLITLVTIFVVLFMSILLLGINYTRAFKVKNEVINILERKQGFNPEAKTEIDNYTDQMHYGGEEDLLKGKCTGTKSNAVDNICIEKKGITMGEDGEDAYAYYKVTTYIYIEIPLVIKGKFLVPVSGETKTIELVE